VLNKAGQGVGETRSRFKKNPGHFAGQTIRGQRIGAFGSSNRVSGSGATLLLTETPAQRVDCAGVEASTEVMPDVLPEATRRCQRAMLRET
jgi:hypothetical protein